MIGRLIHTGQAVIDLVMRVPRLPERGGDVLATTTEPLPGGGFNVMSAAARSGARVLYAGSHGTGGFGDTIRAALTAEGVVLVQEPSREVDTGVVVTLVEPGGERTFATGAGAEGRVRLSHLEHAEAAPDDIVYVTGYSLTHDCNRLALLSWLPRLPGSMVLFDPGPLVAEIDNDTMAAVLSIVDILSCNAREAELLSGAGTTKEAPAKLAALLSATAAVVVRDGARGCLIHVDGETVEVPGFPVEPVDTNGAGDTHCGVLAAELLQGATLREAALRANAAAALSVTRHGPATAPGRAEITALADTVSTPLDA